MGDLTMGTKANIVAIRNKKEYLVTLTTDGTVIGGAVGLIAIAKYDVEVLFELIRANASRSLNMYQLGAVMPISEDNKIITDSETAKANPKGLGEFYLRASADKNKDIFSPLGQSIINYESLDKDSRVHFYNDEFNIDNRVVNSENKRTYIVDYDTKMIKVYGENEGAERAVIFFNEFESYNRDRLVKDLVNSIDVNGYNTDAFNGDDEYLLSQIDSMRHNYLLTLEALENSGITQYNFNEAYVHTLKVFNNAYPHVEVIERFGLVKEHEQVRTSQDFIKIYQPKDVGYLVDNDIPSFEVWSSKSECIKSCPDLKEDDVAEFKECDIEDYSMVS
jgi:hypothetical protein